MLNEAVEVKGKARRRVRKDRAELTSRQCEVRDCVLKGLRISEIAERLHVLPNTVKYHLTLIYRKEGVRDRFTLLAKYHGIAQ